MPSLYPRLPSFRSKSSRPSISDAVSDEPVSESTSWIVMVQQNPRVKTVISALPDQRTVKDVIGDIDTIALQYWGIVIGLLLLALTLAVTPVTVLGIFSGLPYWGEGSYFVCQPDGNVTLPWKDSEYNAWAISSLLDVNLAAGHMPFPVVKLIDVLWDTIVGRGGQALLSILLYRVLSQALLYSMESDCSSFRRFSVTAFQIGTFSALRVFVLDIYRQRKARKIRTTWLVVASAVCTAYVVAFPTLISGITGYQANSNALCESPDDGSLFAVEKLQEINYVIKDGSRVGLTDNYLCVETRYSYDTFHDSYDADTTINIECERYYSYYCYYGCPNNLTSEFDNNKVYNLSAPTLSITMVQTYDNDDAQFVYENETLNATWIEEHLQCQPSANYQWGFSSLGLFVWLLFTCVFTLTLYAIWLQTYLYSRLDRDSRRLGTYRAAVDMAAALREEFADDCETMSDKQFQEELKKRNAGIQVDTEGIPGPRAEYMSLRGIKSLKKLARYQTLRRERATSRAFEET